MGVLEDLQSYSKKGKNRKLHTAYFKTSEGEKTQRKQYKTHEPALKRESEKLRTELILALTFNGYEAKYDGFVSFPSQSGQVG